MTKVERIKNLVKNGETVYADTEAYEVVVDGLDQWFIVCTMNDHTIGLTWRDGQTLNGKDFFYNENGEVKHVQ